MRLESIYLAVKQAVTQGEGVDEKELDMYGADSFSAVFGGRRSSIPGELPGADPAPPPEHVDPPEEGRSPGKGPLSERRKSALLGSKSFLNTVISEDDKSIGEDAALSIDDQPARIKEKHPEPDRERFLVKKARTGKHWVVFCPDLADLTAIQVHFGGACFGRSMVRCTPLSSAEAVARGIPQGRLKVMTSRFAKIIQLTAVLAWISGLPSRPLRKYGKFVYFMWPSLVVILQLVGMATAAFAFHSAKLDITKGILNSTGTLDQQALESSMINMRSLAAFILCIIISAQISWCANVEHFHRPFSSNPLAEYSKTVMVFEMLPVLRKKLKRLYWTLLTPITIALGLILFAMEYTKIPAIADTLFIGAGVIIRVSLCLSIVLHTTSCLLIHIIADVSIISSTDLAVQVMSSLGDDHSFVKLAARYLTLRSAFAECSYTMRHGGVSTQTISACLTIPAVILHLVSCKDGFANPSVYFAFFVFGGSALFQLIPIYHLAKSADALEQALTLFEKRFAMAAVGGLWKSQRRGATTAIHSELVGEQRLQAFRRVHYTAFFDFAKSEGAERSFPAGFTAFGVKITTSLIIQLSYLGASGMIILISRLFL